MTARSSLFSALLLCLAAFPASAQDSPSFTGFITSTARHTPLEVDGRPLLLSQGTRYTCGSILESVEVDHGIPNLPAGAQVKVIGKWDKKVQAWRTEVLCVTALPPKSVSGQGSIDAVTRSGSGMEVTVDGRCLRVAPGSAAALTMAPPLAGGSAPSPGQWMQYAADRQPDGSWLLRNGTVREYLNNYAARHLRKWKPVSVTEPKGGQEGSIKISHLNFATKLVADRALQERVARVGATVIPAWEKASGTLYPDERRVQFYAAKLHAVDCQSFPDGIVLIPEKTAKVLSEDAELAAVLAGCVAEVEEEQVASNANKELLAQGAGAAAWAGPIGLAGWAGGSVYQQHLRELMEEQSARVALTYLKASGYPAAAGPSAWEKLEGKHGQADLSRPPGARAQMLYKALAQERVSADKSLTASMVK